MFKNTPEALLKKIFDSIVKVSLLLVSVALVLNYSIQQKHITTELTYIGQKQEVKIDNSRVITDENHGILNVINDRQFNILRSLKFLIHTTFIFTLLIVVFALIVKFPRRQSIFSIIIIFFTVLIYNRAMHAETQIPTTDKAFTTTLILINGLAFTYFSLRKKFTKNVVNSQSLLVFASQSGNAYNLAKTLKKKSPHLLDIKCISHITPQCITQYQQTLFIASTYGQGQPPEKAHSFLRRLEKIHSFDQTVNYSILALGDSSYPHYCAFGHQLAQLFTERGALPIIDTIEVDRMHEKTINTWWNNITNTLGWEKTTIEQAPFHQLTVVENRCANPNNTNRHAFHISVKRNNLKYQTGDLLEILPKQNKAQCIKQLKALNITPSEIVNHLDQQKTILNALRESEWCHIKTSQAQLLTSKLTPLTSRVYSIVSAENQRENIEILVRQHITSNGSKGVASNYLAECTPNTTITARIKTHPNFHLIDDHAPLILLGAGTGIAPLMSFIRQTVSKTHKRDIWLFFGEQYQTSDFYFKTEINTLLENKNITKLTTAWSRDPNSQYVHNVMLEQQKQLRNWLLNRNAQVYVCGKKEGFGTSTLSALQNILSLDQFISLKQENRLHTDLY